MRITNEMLEQYMSNIELIKQLEEANEVIRIGIKANGGADTKDFTAIVQEKERQSVAGKKAFEEMFGPGWLEKKGLLNTSQYQQVIVTPKVLLSKVR